MQHTRPFTPQPGPTISAWPLLPPSRAHCHLCTSCSSPKKALSLIFFLTNKLWFIFQYSVQARTDVYRMFPSMFSKGLVLAPLEELELRGYGRTVSRTQFSTPRKWHLESICGMTHLFNKYLLNVYIHSILVPDTVLVRDRIVMFTPSIEEWENVARWREGEK